MELTELYITPQGELGTTIGNEDFIIVGGESTIFRDGFLISKRKLK